MRKPAVSTALSSAARAFAALVLLAPPPAAAAFPDKPPRILVGYAAGGSSDLIARFIAEAASPGLGQRILVENKPGLNGVLGAEVVVRAPPDGYSVFQCPMSTLSITPQLIGVSGFEITGWFGICGPKGMPAEALTRWDDAIRQAMQDAAFLKRLRDAGFTPLYEGPAAFARRYESDRKRWGEVIRASKVGAQ